MRLNLFSITNFRSITRAHKIPLSDISTIIGKNNEGKSNILKALNISMGILKKHGVGKKSSVRSLRFPSDDTSYDWERDFPIAKKTGKSNKETIFRLEFSLSEDEMIELKVKIEKYVNERLVIEIRIDEENIPTVNVVKSGKGAKEGFGKKSVTIAEYIVKHISFTYIPAIRTEDHAIDIIQSMLSEELAKIESEVEYMDALQKITDLQKPILENLSEKIRNSLTLFIPSINNVEIVNSQERVRRALRGDCNVFIDDGNKTKLENKGDGIKSLVALSLLKDSNKSESFSLIAIEEPESHLHPGAIHLLRKTIYDLGDANQIIVSTHNPLFVNRDAIHSNILINNGTVNAARNITEIRDILGVQSSDNLTNANFVIVVEGPQDETELRAILSFLSPKIKKAFEDHLLVIDPMRGAGKLNYKLQTLRNAICSYYVVMDRDFAGKQSCQNAQENFLLTTKDYTLIAGHRMSMDSEFEDILSLDIYRNAIIKDYGVDLDCTEFQKTHIKWSDRVKNVFIANGKLWDNTLEEEVKNTVAIKVKENPGSAISSDNQPIIDALVNSIERLISAPIA